MKHEPNERNVQWTLHKDDSDIHRFSNMKWVSTMWTFGNLWISESSLSQQEKFQCSLDLPNMKYNCVLLFFNQLYWVFIYDSKYFLIDTNAKMWTEITDIVIFRKKLVKFLQGVIVGLLHNHLFNKSFRIFRWSHI